MNSQKFNWSEIHLENEKDLLATAASGDEAAFEVIFEGYRHAVYSYGMYLLRDAALADDLVQDVFLKIWLNRLKLNEVDSFRNWLFIVVKHVIFDLLKAQLREQTAIRSLPVTDLSRETEQSILSGEYDSLVHEAFDHLTPQQQLVYQLSRQQGMDTNEIAVKLKISPNTVKTHLVHALRSIRKFVQPHLSGFVLVLLRWLDNF